MNNTQNSNVLNEKNKKSQMDQQPVEQKKAGSSTYLNQDDINKNDINKNAGGKGSQQQGQQQGSNRKNESSESEERDFGTGAEGEEADLDETPSPAFDPKRGSDRTNVNSPSAQP